MENPIYTEDYKGFKIKIFHDINPENPFEDWDSNGKFYHHKDHGTDERAEYIRLRGMENDDEKAKLHPDAVLIDKYEHSGVTYSVQGTGYYCQWDTSPAWAVWFPDKYLMDELKRFKTAKTRRKWCIKYATQACKLFNHWANGEVYGYIVEDSDGEEVASCWGFFEDYGGYPLKAAKEEAEFYTAEAKKKAADAMTPQFLN